MIPSSCQVTPTLTSLPQQLFLADEPIYVFADYVPPGKHNIVALVNTQNKPLKKVSNFLLMVKPRKGKIEPKEKKVKQYKISRVFKKTTSVFRDWQVDTD